MAIIALISVERSAKISLICTCVVLDSRYTLVLSNFHKIAGFIYFGGGGGGDDAGVWLTFWFLRNSQKFNLLLQRAKNKLVQLRHHGLYRAKNVSISSSSDDQHYRLVVD